MRQRTGLGVLGGFFSCLMAAAPPMAPESYALALSTFFGGDAFERAQGCAVDGAGTAWFDDWSLRRVEKIK